MNLMVLKRHIVGDAAFLLTRSASKPRQGVNLVPPAMQRTLLNRLCTGTVMPLYGPSTYAFAKLAYEIFEYVASRLVKPL